MFDDDIDNCAETTARLQQIHIVDPFCFDTGLEIYLSKTEVIVFNNGGPQAYTSWYFQYGVRLNITYVCKYTCIPVCELVY